MTETIELSQHLAAAFKLACLAELETLKPGNVHIFADGHGMVVDDFVRSAAAAAAVIARPESSVGQRILDAVDASWGAVGCNTNLGIVLLCAPLIHAALHGDKPTVRERVEEVLSDLTVSDTELAYRAILRASPAGLGKSPRHDVHQAPGVTLLDAMREAEQRDRIAWQYAHVFTDIFDIGLSRYHEAVSRWGWSAWAATAVHLGFMGDFCDSHIARKHGDEIAQQVRSEAKVHEQALLALENPKNYQRELLRYDASLKARGVNPGTSADLTVATLLVVALDTLLTEKW
jgi:triphosphoribosyl-dephospho-CoA synthase